MTQSESAYVKSLMGEGGKALPDETRTQLESIALDPNLPLIVSDADEVLFHFMDGLERYLHACDMFFDWTSYALFGNIREKASKEPVSAENLHDLLGQFFESETAKLDPVPGAAAALDAFRGRAQVVVLSNVPLAQHGQRTEALHRSGMPYPLVANQGSKGPALRWLQERVRAPIFFIDDIPRNHAAVKRDAEPVWRLHYVANERLSKLLGDAEHAHMRAQNWDDLSRFISGRIG